MTQDEIIEMAQECNLIGMRPHLDGIYSESLIAFAHLVAAKEREACAKVVDEMAKEAEAEQEPSGYIDYYRRKATEIRARGEQV